MTDNDCQAWLTSMDVVGDTREFATLVRRERDSLPSDPTELAGWRFTQKDITENRKGHEHYLTEEQRATVASMLRAGESTDYGKKLKASGLDHLAQLRRMLWSLRPLSEDDLIAHEGHIRDWLVATGCSGGLTHYDVSRRATEVNAALKRMEPDVLAAWVAHQTMELVNSGAYRLSTPSLDAVDKRLAAGEKTAYGQLLKRKRISHDVQLRHLVHRYGRGPIR